MSFTISLLAIMKRYSNSIQRITRRFWQDERGVIQASQAILLVALLGLGMVAGFVSLRDQIIQEYGDASLALENLNQSYYYENIVNTPMGEIVVSSTSYTDTVGAIANLEDPKNNIVVPGSSPEHGIVDPNLLDGDGNPSGGITFSGGTPEGISLIIPPPGPNELPAGGEQGGTP
ncbi:MAG: hypothetical protein HUJ26_03160 [Planctomycetaceae bacterium]|nr:hypothetical protein [Planctomycetaceae bacterium]